MEDNMDYKKIITPEKVIDLGPAHYDTNGIRVDTDAGRIYVETFKRNDGSVITKVRVDPKEEPSLHEDVIFYSNGVIQMKTSPKRKTLYEETVCIDKFRIDAVNAALNHDYGEELDFETNDPILTVPIHFENGARMIINAYAYRSIPYIAPTMFIPDKMHKIDFHTDSLNIDNTFSYTFDGITYRGIISCKE